MREFIKDALITVVDDNDRRIPEYISNGWKERTPTPKQKDDADRRIGKAIEDVNASESGSRKSKGKNTAADKKVNDAIKATAEAVKESAVIDDGLFKNGGLANE